MSLSPTIKAVCFDAFGTLVEITDKRRPYLTLLQALKPEDSQSLRHKLMREFLTLDDCLTEFASALAPETVESLRNDLNRELASIRLRPKAKALLRHLRAQGYKIALCSNLAASYGPPLLKVLPEQTDALILSYETGYIKPETEIYDLVCKKLDLPPQSILFTGDTQSADVDGPKNFGMEAELINPFTERMLGI